MTETTAEARAPAGPVGLGGWLILPMFGLFASPLVGVAQILTYPEIGAAWPYLTAGQAAFVVTELVLNVALVFIAPAVLLYFMFKRLQMFPGWYMIWLAVSPIYLIADALVGYAIFPQVSAAGANELFDKETTRSIARLIIYAAIWIPYTMRSERVANTFTR
ncbi:DUF2569 domain-containing protein [Mesorhizobium sp. ANAO-SY3R2]|uniref:DUF2569 domain-containing protein n=1 Tax=Mesorhizobium sp. ANAO-SY3R2 TaxID=3166644 RepID=UPI00366E352D